MFDVRHPDMNGFCRYTLPSFAPSIRAVVRQPLHKPVAAAPGRETVFKNALTASVQIYALRFAGWRCGIPQTAFYRCYPAKPACVSCHKSSPLLAAYCTQYFKRRRMRGQRINTSRQIERDYNPCLLFPIGHFQVRLDFASRSHSPHFSAIMMPTAQRLCLRARRGPSESTIRLGTTKPKEGCSFALQRRDCVSTGRTGGVNFMSYRQQYNNISRMAQIDCRGLCSPQACQINQKNVWHSDTFAHKFAEQGECNGN